MRHTHVLGFPIINNIMKNFVIALTILSAVLAVITYQLIPNYPPYLQNSIPLQRKLFSAAFHALFKFAIWTERFGLIDESANVMHWMFTIRVKEPPPPEGVDLENRTISGLPVLIFRPKSINGLVTRAIIYFHGGGFTIGSTLSHYSWTLRLANMTNSVVISVEYPLAPKHPFPEAINECIRFTKTVFDSANSLGVDRNRIAVAGDSAGGNLAAVIALDLAGTTDYPLKAQVLLSPVLVAAGVSSLPSYAHYHRLFIIHLDWFIVKYAGMSYTTSVEAAITSEHHISAKDLIRIQRYVNISALPNDLLDLIPDRHNATTRVSSANEFEMATRPKEVAVVGEMALTQRAWPLIFEDESRLKRVAPALIQNCEFDPFRDEALLYFNRLRSLGVDVSLSFLQKAVHAEPLVKEIMGAPPSAASLKGLGDILKFVEERL